MPEYEQRPIQTLAFQLRHSSSPFILQQFILRHYILYFAGVLTSAPVQTLAPAQTPALVQIPALPKFAENRYDYTLAIKFSTMRKTKISNFKAKNSWPASRSPSQSNY